MFIQTESTPNPNTMKFLPGQVVMPQGTKFYTSKEAAAESPLALRLFAINGVIAIFLGADFITVTKKEEEGWDILKPLLLTSVMEHFVAGQPVIHAAKPAAAASDNSDESPIVKQIKELIETRVRPAVAMDGGDIIFHGYENGIVKLEMHGSCAGCPSSTATLKSGIENMLKHYVPEVQSVEAVM